MLSKIDYEALARLKPAGKEDLKLWASLAASGLLYSPAMVASAAAGVGALPFIGSAIDPWSLANAGLVSAAGGLSVFSGRQIGRNSAYRVDTSAARMLSSDVNLTSSPNLPSKETIQSWKGMCLGFRVDDGEPVIVDWDSWMRHCFIVGQSGVGKTVLGEWLMFQQIVHGGGMIFIDGKLDEANLKKIFEMATYAGRREDVLVINPGNPNQSNSYNPILYGDSDEVSSRILSLIPSAESNPGADHYRQSANQAISTVIAAIQSIPANSGISSIKGAAYNFVDLSILLQNDKAILHLENMVPPSSDGGRQFKLWLDQFKNSKDGDISIDLKKMRDLFGGVGGRMHQFGTGNFGAITSSYDPEVNLYDAIIRNKIIYVALPTMGKAEAASNFGKMIVGDYRTAVSWIQALPEHLRPNPPTLCFFDEAGSYVTQSWSRIFEQARSARQALVPAVQTLSNLDSVSPELTAMVIGNTNTKVMFRLGESDTIERMNALIGKESVAQRSVSFSASESSGGSPDSLGSDSESKGTGIGLSYREAEVERVKPTTITKLGIGEAVVLYENSKLHHIKVPRVRFDSSVTQSLSSVEINHRKGRFVKGLDFYSKANQFLKGA